MANYCTTTDVRIYNPKRTYNTTSKPTVSQVSSIIVLVTGEMNARIGAMGVSMPIAITPVTAQNTILRMMCACGSAWRAEEATFMGGNKQETDHIAHLRDEYENWYSMIAAQPAIVAGGSGARFHSLEVDEPDTLRPHEPFLTNEKDW